MKSRGILELRETNSHYFTVLSAKLSIVVTTYFWRKSPRSVEGEEEKAGPKTKKVDILIVAVFANNAKVARPYRRCTELTKTIALMGFIADAGDAKILCTVVKLPTYLLGQAAHMEQCPARSVPLISC